MKRISNNKKFSTKKKIIIIILSVILCFSVIAVLIINIGLPLREQINNDYIRNIAFSTEEKPKNSSSISNTSSINKKNKKHNKTTKQHNDTTESASSNINWNGLEKENNEIVGWIKINNTTINYPVLWHPSDTQDSKYYLWRNYKGEPSSYGSIFMDGHVCSPESQNHVLYGHHTNDGLMFGPLMNYGTYSGNLEFYRSSPTITYYSKNRKGSNIYKIIGIVKTNADAYKSDFNYIMCSFFNDEAVLDYVDAVKQRSLIDCPVKVNEKDKLLTLTTCSYEATDNRTVIVARQLRKNESSKINISKAKLNSNIKKKGVSCFIKDYKKNKTPWYDGDFFKNHSKVSS